MLSGLELALAPTFREDFRESLYRMMGALTGLGVTVAASVCESFTSGLGTAGTMALAMQGARGEQGATRFAGHFAWALMGNTRRSAATSFVRGQ